MSAPPDAASTLATFTTPPGWLSARAVDGLVRGLVALGPAGRARLAAAVGRLAFGLGIRRRVTLDNLALALPGLAEAERWGIARAAYVNMARVVLEAVSGPGRPAAEAATLLTDGAGTDAFYAAVRGGRGVLLATGHLGNWEVFGEGLLRRGVPLSAVVWPLKGALNARLIESRVRLGMELIHPRGAVQGVLRALRQGRTVAVLVDQAVTPEKGVWVPFFGHLAATAPALSLAALRSGAPVFVGHVRHGEGAGLVFEAEAFTPPARSGELRTDVAAHTAAVTARLEATIRRLPEQWLWLHRRWKHRPPPEALPAPTSQVEERVVPGSAAR